MTALSAAILTAFCLVLCCNVYVAILRRAGVDLQRVVQGICAGVIVAAFVWGWL